MKSVIVLLLFITVVFSLSACENAEHTKCKEKASQYWNPKEDNSSKQTQYWAAIKRCKEKYE